MPQDPESPILNALYHGQREEAQRLAVGATLTIFEAAALGRNDRISELLDGNAALVNAWAPDGHTPLGLAAFFAGEPTVRLLLDRGAAIDAAARNALQVQALHAAVASRNGASVALLLERGADPNARQQAGYTPLMAAAAEGREDLVDMLLARGADARPTGDQQKTAADLAREHGHVDLADRLGRR